MNRNETTVFVYLWKYDNGVEFTDKTAVSSGSFCNRARTEEDETADEWQDLAQLDAQEFPLGMMRSISGSLHAL